MDAQTTRWRLIGSTFVAGVTTVGLSMSAMAARQDATPSDEEAATPQSEPSPRGEATMPEWVFAVLDYQDPYVGDGTVPEEGTRSIGAEVEMRNDSDVPLNFAATSVRLRDSDGTEHLPGPAVGSEPQLGSLNMPAGDSVKGWIWFTVPDDAEVEEMFYVAPPPRLVISLGGE